MDRLKHSREILETPTCKSCGSAMQWCRSELVKFAPVTNWHLFNCPSCLLLAESETIYDCGRARLRRQTSASRSTG